MTTRLDDIPVATPQGFTRAAIFRARFIIFIIRTNTVEPGRNLTCTYVHIILLYTNVFVACVRRNSRYETATARRGKLAHIYTPSGRGPGGGGGGAHCTPPWLYYLHNSMVVGYQWDVPKYWATGRRHFCGFRARISRQPQQCLCMYTRKPVVPCENRLRTSLQRCVSQVCTYTARDPPKCMRIYQRVIIYFSRSVLLCVCTAERKLMIFRGVHAYRCCTRLL